MKREPFHPLEILLVLVECVLAVGAIGAGVMLLVTSGEGLPRSILEPSPFSSFLVPGVALVLLQGVVPGVVAVGALLRRTWARAGHPMVGVVTITWIVVQVAMIGLISVMMPIVFGLGVLLLAAGTYRLLQGRDPLGRTVEPSALLDAWAPDLSFADTIAVFAPVSPAMALRALQEVTPREMPLAMVAGELRYLPRRLSAEARKAATRRDQSFLAQILGGGAVVLEETPGRELVIGSAGKLHRLDDQRPVRFESVEAFRRFREPGYQKLFMSLRAIPCGGGTILALEHRTMPLDAEARRGFARYWVGIRPGGAFVTRQLLRAARRRAIRASAPTGRRRAHAS